MPCDDACKKIIINTTFMAGLSSVLAGVSSDNGVAQAAAKLATAASIHASMLNALGLRLAKDEHVGFTGCEQAKTLLHWIDGVGTDVFADPSRIVDQLDAWTEGEWQAIRELAAGKMP